MYVFICMLLLLLHIVCYLNGRTLFCANICRCVNVCAESALNGSSILIVQIDMQHYGKSTKSPKQQQKPTEREKKTKTHTYSTNIESFSYFFFPKHQFQHNVSHLISLPCTIFGITTTYFNDEKYSVFLSLRVKAAKFIQHNFFDLVMK